MSRYPRWMRTQHQADDLAKVAAIVDGTTNRPDPRARRNGHRSAEGDTRRLRGWPIVARGVPGMSTESQRLLAKLENQPLRTVATPGYTHTQARPQ